MRTEAGRAAGRAGVDALGGRRGRRSVNVVPTSGSLSTSNRPPWPSTMLWLIDSPSPVPRTAAWTEPAGACSPLVEKK